MTEQKRIPIADPVAEYQELAAEIDAAVKRVLGSGRYILGPEGEGLEREIAAYVGTEHAVGCNSGTDALHLALLAAGIRPGDEVVVPAFTFIATAEAVSYIGAKPVFTDVDPDTFCMDVKSLEACLSPRTKAVIPVHLYGQTAPIEQIAAICHERKLTLIEDCAQSLGADERGRKAGAWGDYGCFSFYPTKNLAAAGDAGLITTRDAKSAERLRMLRHHGSRQTYLHEILGYNSRLDEIQAARLQQPAGRDPGGDPAHQVPPARPLQREPHRLRRALPQGPRGREAGVAGRAQARQARVAPVHGEGGAPRRGEGGDERGGHHDDGLLPRAAAPHADL
jgi:dTDP-4-amino-4,6-dideoxygalactose transaminase